LKTPRFDNTIYYFTIRSSKKSSLNPDDSYLFESFDIMIYLLFSNCGLIAAEIWLVSISN